MSSDPQILDNTTISRENNDPSPFSLFLDLFNNESEPERKIRLAIDFMRSSLAQPESPHFKDFWEGRRLCLPIFKENINAKSRTLLWAEYIEISAEARRLKEILDEQSAFAVEQIELAIVALEKDLENYDAQLAQFPEIPFPHNCEPLARKEEVYHNLQRELNFLNTFASRINSMRKEIIKTEMRIRHKNRFFEKLSAAGDRIFPRRKDLIKEISETFSADVGHFIQNYFQGDAEADPTPLFVLREDIKTLQSFAKVLTLNTQAFSETRLHLSQCWDQLKEREKERKKEISAKRIVFKQNYDVILAKIQVFAEAVLIGLAEEEERKQVDEILEAMRGVELGREEVKALRDEIFKAREPLMQKKKEEEERRANEAREAERLKKAKTEEFKSKVSDLLGQAEGMEMDPLILAKDELLKELETIILTKSEKLPVEKLFKLIKEKIEEKREKALLNLSDADLQALQQLKSFLEEKKQERQQIKSSLEQFRKTLGGSGYDFEKAIQIREIVENEKARLDKINSSIEEIEEKIGNFES